jgi:hypothetical protein
MTLCDRCQTRPACCVVGATRHYSYSDKVDFGDEICMPLEAAGLLKIVMTHHWWTTPYLGRSAWLQLCPVCSGRV